MLGTTDTTAASASNPSPHEVAEADARSSVPAIEEIEVISTHDLNAAPDTIPALGTSECCYGFFTSCMISITQIINKAASHPFTRPIVSFMLAAASAALSYAAAEAYQEDVEFSAVYTVIPSTVFAGFSAQLAMEYLFPEGMKKINYYRTMYIFEILVVPGLNLLNGNLFPALFPETHPPKQQEWVSYFFTASMLGFYFGGILANSIRRSYQENQKGKVNVEMQMLSSETSPIPQETSIPACFDKSDYSRLPYQLGSAFLSLSAIGLGYFIRYQYSQRNSIDSLSVFSMLLRHAGFAVLGWLTMGFMLPKFRDYDANTLQQVSLYLLGPTIQLGNQPYNDVCLLLTGMILKLNQHYANQSFINQHQKNTRTNAQLVEIFRGKQKLIEDMQKNILKQIHDNRWKERLITVVYNLFFFIALLPVAVYLSTGFEDFGITDSLSTFIFSTALITPRIYQWLDDTTHQTTLTPHQNKIRENLDYYLLHNLIPLGFMSIYTGRMYIRYCRLADYATLVYPSNGSNQGTLVNDFLALILGGIFAVTASVYFGFFRQMRRELSAIDFNQADFMQLSESLLSIENQRGENTDKEKVIELSCCQQAEILRRIGMFPSRKKSDVIAAAEQNNVWDKVNIKTVPHMFYEKAQYLHSRRMNAFANAVAVSNNVTSRMSVLDTAKNIVFGL